MFARCVVMPPEMPTVLSLPHDDDGAFLLEKADAQAQAGLVLAEHEIGLVAGMKATRARRVLRDGDFRYRYDWFGRVGTRRVLLRFYDGDLAP